MGDNVTKESTTMLQKESKHYIFNYHKNSLADKDLDFIIDLQERCFEHITRVLKTTPPTKINYYLCESAEEVGQLVGCEPNNGMACFPNTIYAVYNETAQCIGFHEDAHIIAYHINNPENSAIHEGLAMYFDRQWWGINNWDWTLYYIQQEKYVGIDQLLQEDVFDNIDCSISYPILGTFVDWLISTYGIDKFLELYKQKEISSTTQQIYGLTAKELDEKFVAYAKLFFLDETIKDRISQIIDQMA